MNKIINILRKYLEGFLELFYPEFCVACDENLLSQEKVLCTSCLYKLPRTHFHKVSGNPIEQAFWGRQEIERATAYYFFKKASVYQKLLHQLKYHGKSEVGIEMGRQFGAEIANEDAFKNVDYIIPVPLHPKKERKRGYNQSEMIAQGMAEFLEGELETKVLVRKTYTETQTKKERYERWENVKEVFGCKYPEKIEGKHVLLVDDVMTTGATLEGCTLVLKDAANVKVSVACLAYTAI